MTRATIVVAAALLSGLAITAVARKHDATIAPPPGDVPVIVELFTSEGCSSCPPADLLLIDLLKTQPVKGARIVGLSEHVDYWNSLGWKDPFSDHAFSERQSAYAAAAGSGQIYTPQMVVDGVASFVGSDRRAALAAVAAATVKPKASLELRWAESARGSLHIALAGAPAARADVFLSIVEDGLSTPVRAGENAGHVLPHSAVTRRLTKIGRADAEGRFSRDGVPVDFATTWIRSSLQIVVFAQLASTHDVVAAAAIAPAPAGRAPRMKF